MADRLSPLETKDRAHTALQALVGFVPEDRRGPAVGELLRVVYDALGATPVASAATAARRRRRPPWPKAAPPAGSSRTTAGELWVIAELNRAHAAASDEGRANLAAVFAAYEPFRRWWRIRRCEHVPCPGPFFVDRSPDGHGCSCATHRRRRVARTRRPPRA